MPNKNKAALRQVVLFPLAAIFFAIIATLIGLEIILRFLPVNEGLRVAALNDKQPVMHFEPNRTSKWSRGWNFSITNKVHSNNYGFLNDQNYDPAEKKPLLAVIGDSFVEAAMVPYPKTLQGRLATSVNSFGRVYSFGISGAGLSDYLILAEYVNKTFKPDGIIFIIISNDFDESIQKSSGHYYFSVEPNTGELVLKRADYDIGFFRKIFRNSSLFMYLMTDVIFRRGYQTNIKKTKDEKAISDLKMAVNTFFKELPKRSGLDSSRILFAVDGMRELIYNPEKSIEAKGCDFDIMRRYFIDKSTELGYETIDLQNVFEKHHKSHKQRFEYPTDEHWNERGHEVAASAIIKSSFFGKLSR